MSSTTEQPRLPWLEASSRSEQFFLLAQERYRIKLRRERHEARPWTDDKVLQTYRFCNVFREDDKTTVWFRENIREPLRGTTWAVIVATVAFRWFNRIEVGEKLLPMFLSGEWCSVTVFNKLQNVKPLVTGAYMVKTPAGMSKLRGICWCMEQFFKTDIFEGVMRAKTLREAWELLTKVPYLGPFMAYEVVSDLRHTDMLRGAHDINTWANPGPGACRGMGWIVEGHPDVYDRNSDRQVAEVEGRMRDLLVESRKASMWPWQTRPWEMREVEHWLCEYDKWCRAHFKGQSLKRRFDTSGS